MSLEAAIGIEVRPCFIAIRQNRSVGRTRGLISRVSSISKDATPNPASAGGTSMGSGTQMEAIQSIRIREGAQLSAIAA